MLDQRHRAVVHQHVLQRHRRVVLRHADHDLAPELGHDEHVGLVDRREALPPLHRHVEGRPRHALDLARGVGHGVHGPRPAVGELLAPPRLAEVEPARQLPDHHQVRALHDRAPEGRRVDEHGKAAGGPQVGEQVQLLAKPEQAPLRTLLRRRVVPLGPPHRPEEDGVALLAESQRGLGQRFPGGVDGAPADQGRLELEGSAGGLPDEVEDLLRLRRDFLADAVSGQHRDLVDGHQIMPPSPFVASAQSAGSPGSVPAGTAGAPHRHDAPLRPTPTTSR